MFCILRLRGQHKNYVPKFTHLHTHSHYSLLDGLSKIPDLVERTKELGMDSIALTDHGVLYGAVEFYKAAKKNGDQADPRRRDIRCAARPVFERTKRALLPFDFIVRESRPGWKNLIKLVSKAHLEGFYYKPRVDQDLLREHHEGSDRFVGMPRRRDCALPARWKIRRCKSERARISGNFWQGKLFFGRSKSIRTFRNRKKSNRCW